MADKNRDRVKASSSGVTVTDSMGRPVVQDGETVKQNAQPKPKKKPRK